MQQGNVMSEFDVDAYFDAIEIPKVKVEGKWYKARVLSVEEWSPYQMRYRQYLEGLRDLLPEEKQDEDFKNIDDSDFSDLAKLELLQNDWNVLRVEYFEALFGHWKSKYKPWTWFRPNVVEELENLPNRDLVFGDFFALRVAATVISARNQTNGTS